MKQTHYWSSSLAAFKRCASSRYYYNLNVIIVTLSFISVDCFNTQNLFRSGWLPFQKYVWMILVVTRLAPLPVYLASHRLQRAAALSGLHPGPRLFAVAEAIVRILFARANYKCQI